MFYIKLPPRRPMTYAKSPMREALIAASLTGYMSPFKTLFYQTDASGHEVFSIESSNNFNNPYAQAMEEMYWPDKRAPKVTDVDSCLTWLNWLILDRRIKLPWGQIFRDKITKGVSDNEDEEGRLNVNYISHAQTQWEKVHNVWAPRPGYWVPTHDGIFHEGTLVPFETVPGRKQAMRRMESAGMPEEYTSYFFRLDTYARDAFAARYFHQNGRFDVYISADPNDDGNLRIGSLPALPEVRRPEIQLM